MIPPKKTSNVGAPFHPGWNVALPLMTCGVALLAWHLSIEVFALPRVLLPSPVDVVTATVEEAPLLLAALGRTTLAALAGFGLSLIFGTAAAMIFAQSAWVRASLFPYAIFLQTVPIIAIAPLIVIWVGEGMSAVVLVSLMVSFFPIVTNGTVGLLSPSQDQRELFQLYAATRWQTLWKLRLPTALPYLVAGARISSGLSVLGAIVGEYFAGAGSQSPGLGYLVFAAKDQFALDRLFAAVFLSTLLGVLLFRIVGYCGDRWLLYWAPSTTL